MIDRIVALFPKSWRTTVCGIVALLAFLASFFSYLMPAEERAMFEKAMQGLTVIAITAGLTFSRDRNVSTEEERSGRGCGSAGGGRRKDKSE